MPTVHIGQVVRNAVAFNFKSWTQRPFGPDSDMESLLETVETLFHILRSRDVDYLLVSGIAMLQYVEGRKRKISI